MTLEDKTIQCSDCKVNFTFTAGEQEFYATKGFSNTPKRCPACRARKKMERGGDGDQNYRSRSWGR